MKWYEGSIPEAIQEARRNASVFVVYITGGDELSKKMDSTWEDEEVRMTCEQARNVGIRLQANSEECSQFSQIYPVVCVPCTYFIGSNGVPLEVTGGAVEPKDLIQTMRKARQMNDGQLQNTSSTLPAMPVSQPDTTSVSSGAASASAVPATTPTEAQPGGGLVSEDAPAMTLPEPSSVEASSQSTMSKEERVERAKVLIAQKREEKVKEKAEKEKKEESERRKMGQDMVNLKHWKAEQEAKEVKEQMRKDREEEKRARERVREQIARDRAERAVKYQKEKHDADIAKQEAQAAKVGAQAQKLSQQDAVRRETARIQFRLPDGSSITNQFPSSDSLASARHFLEEQVGNRFGHFQMSTLYPKRNFTEEDMASSLLDLSLAPSAVVVVLPGGRRTVVSQKGGSSGDSFIWILLAPLVALWNVIYNFLFGAPAKAPKPQPTETSSSTPSEDSGSKAKPDPRSTRPKSSYGLRSRKEGNVRRFTSDDDDDDSATWNGNSTQQM